MKKPQDDDLGDCPMCEKKFGIKAPLVRTERKMGKNTMRFSANRLIIGCSRYKKGCTYGPQKTDPFAMLGFGSKTC